MRRAFKILGKSLLYGLLGLVLLFSAAVGGLYVFSKPIKKKVTQLISNQLASPVTIRDIQLSVFKDFPLVSISFHSIQAAESHKLTGQPLMQLESFKVTINPWNIVRGNYRFENIQLNNGSINAAKTPQFNNYSILKSTKNAGNEEFSVQFRKIVFNNIAFKFIDGGTGDTVSLLVKSLQLSGSFNDKEYDLLTTGKIIPQVVKLAGNSLKIEKPVNFSTSFRVNRPDSSYTFTRTRLIIEDFNFIVNGKITAKEKNTHCKLQAQADNIRLEQLLDLIPQKYLTDLAGYQSHGTLECTLNVEGEVGNEKVPDVNATFKIAGGRLKKEGLDAELTDINLNGKLEYEKRGGITFSSLELVQASARLNGETISGALKVSDFKNPYLQGRLEGTVKLQQWVKLFKVPAVDTLEGVARIAITAEGKVEDFKKSSEGMPAKFEGNLELQDVKLALKESSYTYGMINGRLYADNNRLQIDTLHGSINGNVVGISGKAQNLLGYLFSSNERLDVEGRLTSPHIDVPALTAIAAPKTGNTDTTGFVMPKNMAFTLGSRIGKVTYNRFVAQNVVGTVSLHDGVIALNNLEFKAMKGAVKLTGNVFDKGQGRYVISAEMEATGLDIKQLFGQCGNFGQDALTEDNLEGILDARLQLAAPANKYLALNTAKMFVKSHISISGGRLFDYKPMEKLSGFVKVEELRDISFDRLENDIEIKEGIIHIPRMEIKNSAVNLVAEGYHTFENYMEYRFRVRLKDVVAKKFSSKKTASASYEEDKEGMNLFIVMKGYADNLEIRWDSKNALKKIKEDIKTEKNSLVDVLRDEFNIRKKDGTTGKPDGEAKKEEGLEEWETDIPK